MSGRAAGVLACRWRTVVLRGARVPCLAAPRVLRACCGAAIPRSARRSAPAGPRRCRRSAAAMRRRLACCGVVALQPRRHRPRRRPACRGSACGRRPATAISILTEMAGIALEIGAAHQRPVDARRGNFQPIGAVDRIGDIEHRRQRARGASQSSISMVPSGRSAMIWTVQPDSPETRTRTSRYPSAFSTGSATMATRAAIPVSAISRRSVRHVGIDRIRHSFSRPHAATIRSVSARIARVPVLPGSAGNKKERVPGGAHSHEPIGYIRPL